MNIRIAKGYGPKTISIGGTEVHVGVLKAAYLLEPEDSKELLLSQGLSEDQFQAIISAMADIQFKNTRTYVLQEEAIEMLDWGIVE